MPEAGVGEAAPVQEEQQGGGVAEAITQTDATLAKLAGAAPEAVREQFQAALEAFRSAVESLDQATEGGGGGGPVAPEQGASGAVPMSHQMKG